MPETGDGLLPCAKSAAEPPRGRSPDFRLGLAACMASLRSPEPSQALRAQWHHSGSLPGHSGATVPVFHRLPSSGLRGVPPRLGHLEARYSIGPDCSEPATRPLAPAPLLPYTRGVPPCAGGW